MGGPQWARWAFVMVFSATLMHWSSALPNPEPQTDESQMEDTEAEDKPKLLYILLDGFRWDYLDKQTANALPGFTRFLKEGVRAKWTKPIFPTVSYPSWTTLVTGLYSESHGISGNSFYDPEAKEMFSLSDSDTTGKPKWWTSEPIWTTAEKAGLKTAQYIWSRCDVPFEGLVTHHCEPYTDDLKKDNFLRNTMKALQKFDEGYDFVQVYSVHVDEMGHQYGPGSEEVQKAVRDMDSTIDILLDELENRQLMDKVNIVIVSDHGMADTSREAITVHDIDQYLDASLVENIADYGPFMSIKVNEENFEEVYERLAPMPGVAVYKKKDIPEGYHFKEGKYVHEILVVSHQGQYIMGSNSNKQFPKVTGNIPLGSHGYDIDVASMRGIFMAKGPAFQKNLILNEISMVDVYPVLTNVLKLVALPNNGTWSNVEGAFNPSHRYPKQANDAAVATPASLASLFLSLISVLVIRYI